MPSPSIVITLDGPAGSGKSTVARRLAKRLGLEFLDTGAMYRAITATCLDQSLQPSDHPDAAVAMAQRMTVWFDWQQDPPRVHVTLDGQSTDVTDRLRDRDVTEHVSTIAQLPQVRALLVEAQRRIGRQHPRLVTEGRDQGSVVFPDAAVKFYLDASSRVRAQRRTRELHEAGKAADELEILQQIVIRDRKDASRSDGPLICPKDALRVDTSHMSLDEVVAFLERSVRDRLAEALESHQMEANGCHGS